MEDLYPRIEDYLDNVLSDAERVEFEADVQNDPTLAAALAATKEARERLARQWAQASAEATLRQTLQDVGKQHFTGKSQTSRSARSVSLGRWWMAAAAAAAVLLVWLAWPPSTDTLYQRYRLFPEASFALKSGADAPTPSLTDAAQAFNNKDFAAAQATLSTHLRTKPDDLEARFFMALCQLELGQLDEAENTLSSLVSPETAWSGEARWYLALAHLRNKKPEACKAVLRQIPAGAPHHAEAQALLRKI